MSPVRPRQLHRSALALAVASALAVALPACAPEPTNAGPEEPSASAVSEPDGTDAAGSDPDGATATGTIGVDFPDPDAVIADATFPVPGTTGQQLRVGIESLTVRDGVTELRLVLTPQWDGSDIRIYTMLGAQGDVLEGLKLIDIPNLKEYQTLRAGGSRWTTDPYWGGTEGGQPVGFQAFFPAPEDEVDSFDVVINPSWPAFEAVPLTREG